MVYQQQDEFASGQDWSGDVRVSVLAPDILALTCQDTV